MPLSLVLLALLIAGCDTGDTCADEVVRIAVRVVNEASSPVKTLRTTLTNTRNLDAIGFTAADSTGLYTVLTDNNLAFVQRSGDRLTFESTNDTLVASAEFVIGREACHVAKLEGPDTIVASRTVSGG